MIPPVETIRNLIALADQDNEEGRTAAHKAIKMLKKHGYVITIGTQQPGDAPGTPRAPWTPDPSPPPAPAPTTSRRWSGALAIVVDETQKFFQTLNVLPRDIPITGVQLAPASDPGFCVCGYRYRRGELVSRFPPHRCAKCIARRNAGGRRNAG